MKNMVTIGDIYRKLDEIAPFSLAESWDNCGLLVGEANAPVTACVIGLDVTLPVIRQAVQAHAQLIVTHHPVIFHPLKCLPGDSVAYHLAREGIGVISAHTNLDLAEGGVNDALFDALELSEKEAFSNEDNLGRIGRLPRPFSPGELAAYLKEKLSSDGVSWIPAGKKRIERVALVSGAGGDYVGAAAAAGADAYLTGEAKHSDRIEALNRGIHLFTAGHHHTEKVVLPCLKSVLAAGFPEVDFIVTEEFPEESL